MSDARRRWEDNPFLVLGLGPSSSRMEIERAGQKLLSMLELKLPAARTYAGPWGPVARDADKVRAALAELRDPSRRARHERLAVLPSGAPPPDAPAWEEAKAAFGWKGL